MIVFLIWWFIGLIIIGTTEYLDKNERNVTLGYIFNLFFLTLLGPMLIILVLFVMFLFWIQGEPRTLFKIKGRK